MDDDEKDLMLKFDEKDEQRKQQFVKRKNDWLKNRKKDYDGPHGNDLNEMA